MPLFYLLGLEELEPRSPGEAVFLGLLLCLINGMLAALVGSSLLLWVVTRQERARKKEGRDAASPGEQATALIAFLREEWEIFAWCPADMPGIPREFAEHALCIKQNTKPVKQALRRFSEPKSRAIGEEVNRLLDDQFIRETKKATWIANPVLVPKKDTD